MMFFKAVTGISKICSVFLTGVDIGAIFSPIDVYKVINV